MPATQILNITAPRSGAAALTDLKDHIEALWKLVPLTATAVGGTSSAITCTIAPAPATLAVGLAIWVLFPVAPAAGATFRPNAYTAKPLLRPDGVAVVSGDVTAGLALVRYDGTGWRVITPPFAHVAGGVGSTQITITTSSAMTLAVGATGTAASFNGTGSGSWRLMSKTVNKGLGYTNSIICLIERIR